MHLTPINPADHLRENETDLVDELVDEFDEPTPGLLLATLGTAIAVLMMLMDLI